MKKNKKVQVAVRVRPIIYQYQDNQAWSVIEQSKKITSLPRSQALRNNSMALNQDYTNGLSKKKSKNETNNVYEFSLDHVFKDTDSNKTIYEQCCKDVVKQFMEGNNATIFMYGQTTSGKTYTMLGDQHTQGLITYSLKDIFGKSKINLNIVISYLEIYNQQINDLLQQGANNLKIVDQVVQGLSQTQVTSIQQAFQLLNQGQYQRSYAEKKYHDHSSRSHTIFQIKMIGKDGKAKAMLNLVDLSGSQRLSDEQSTQQTAYINKSLFTLSNVIYKLANPKKNAHIPFRDSKLTRLLAPSLTTSKKTMIICTVSPAQINFSQTLSTLRFATQSRKIQLKSLDESLNESMDVNRRKISQLVEQNNLLKKNLSFAQQNKQNELNFIQSKMKYLQNILGKGKDRSLSWKNKMKDLKQQYEKNIQTLQKEYLKAMINLTSSELKINKEQIKQLINLNNTSLQS